MMRTGETYRCTDPGCGCEIEVIKGSEAGRGASSPRCCCGREMTLLSGQPSAMEGEARAS
jgi:hypothetical protein